jgi:hypothetical protein
MKKVKKRAFAETTCPVCGVYSLTYLDHEECRRDYMPVTLVIRLWPGTKSTYILEPALKKLALRIRSLESPSVYAVDVPVHTPVTVCKRLLKADDRIFEWYVRVWDFPGDTEGMKMANEIPPVCETHVNFWPSLIYTQRLPSLVEKDALK